MFIVLQKTYSTPPEEVYVFDTIAGHAQTYGRLVAFLNGDQGAASLPSAGPFPEEPEAPWFNSLRFVKTDGPILTSRTKDGALEVAGRPEYLLRYANEFQFGPNDDHHHPEQAFELSELHPKSEMIVLQTFLDPEEDA